MKAQDLEAWIVARIARALRAEAQEIDVRAPLTTLGVDSATAVEIVGELEDLLGTPLSATLVFDHATVEAISRHLTTGETLRAAETPAGAAPGEPIAVVGLACRVPGAADATELWRLLRDGRDGISAAEASPRAQEFRRRHPGQRAGLLERVDEFDAGFFAITPREAVRMDPQQRLLLEVAWEALEDGGIVPASLAGTRSGVFVGISFSEYGATHLHEPGFADGYAGTGNALSVAANRLSYLLDLRGPSMAVDTACSSSLVGIHLACRSLRAGDCDLALVGGVNVILTAAVGGDFASAGVMAPDGRCKTFDNRADGYVRSEGAGVVVLKPLSAALAAGDRVYCTIPGSAVNHDGRTNGLLAPSQASQAFLLRTACADAGADARDVVYVEAHGTGTLLGDAVEAQALGTVIGSGRPVGSPLRVGSVKSNVGHLEAAAGVVGAIKVALSLHHGRIPPSIHWTDPNENVNFDALNLEVQRELTPWPDEGGRRLAGVSSFGFGGANAHVVLERAPSAPQVEDADDADAEPQLVTLSARTPAALDELAQRYLDSLVGGPLSTAPSLRGLARSAATRRQHHEHRLAVVASTPWELVDGLRAVRSGHRAKGVRQGRTGQRPPRVALVFGGQSSRWWPWNDDVLGREPAFRDTFTACQSIARERWGLDLSAGITRAGATSASPSLPLSQVAFFALQASTAVLYGSWGVRPAAVVGHSLGEVAAAVTAGCLSLEDGLEVAYHRGRCIEERAPAGRMAVIGLPEDETSQLVESFGGSVVTAAINSPSSTVISGEPTAVSQAVERITMAGGFGRVLDAVGFASHSPDMDAVAEALAASIPHVTPGAPTIPMLSTVAGAGESDVAVGAPAYWALNIRRPVHLLDALRRAADDGIDVFLEVSPEPGLGRAIRESLPDDTGRLVVLPSTPVDRSSTVQALETLAELYIEGVPLSWGPTAQHTCALPTYPWQRTPYWLEPQATLAGPAQAGDDPLLGRRADLADFGGHVWNSVVSTGRLALLGDHVVLGEVVLPATAYVEMARTAAAALGAEGPHVLRDLRLRTPRLLSGAEESLVQTVLSGPAAGPLALRVYGRHPREATWTLHAEGLLDPGDPGDPPAELAPPPNGADGLDEVDVAALYRALDHAGLAYGPSFRGLDRLWTDGQRAVGHVVADGRHGGSGAGLRVAFLDACLHTCAPLVGAAQPDRPWVPTACAAVVWHKAVPPDSAVVHATPSEQRGRVAVVDVVVTDESGDPVVELRGLRLQELPGAGSPDAPDSVWTYRVEWEPRPPALVDEAACPADAATPWLLVADRGAVAADVRDAFAVGGQPTQTLDVFDGAEDGARLPGRKELRARLADLRPATGWRGIVVLWPLDLPADDVDHDRIADGEAVCLAAVDLLRALGTALEAPPPIWFVTTGSLAAAPLGGVVKAVPLELPDVRCTVVDVGGAPAPVVAEQLTREVVADGGDGWVTWRDGVRAVPRLAPEPMPAPADPAGPVVAGTALVTGAFGALGSVLVRWLASRGVRSFVLVGRNDPPPPAAALVERLEAEGIQVVTARADAARRDDVARLMAGLPAGLPGITGVFHLAGLLADGALVDLGHEEFTRVLAPKVRGAWNLHDATRHLPLDVFVLFSSAVSVLGSPGQANYAAANAFLDAIALHRRSQGLPGLSINWGPWGEVGLAAERADDRRAQFASMFDPDEAVDLVGRFLAADLDQVLVLPYDLRNLLQHYPKVAGRDFFARVADEALLAHHGRSGGPRSYARPDLATEHVAARSDLERLIQALWERALSIEGIGVRDGFFELGGDSVVANQIAVQIERRFQVEIDREAVFDDMTIEGVAALVEVELEKKMNELSDEAVDDLLGALEA